MNNVPARSFIYNTLDRFSQFALLLSILLADVGFNGVFNRSLGATILLPGFGGRLYSLGGGFVCRQFNLLFNRYKAGI